MLGGLGRGRFRTFFFFWILVSSPQLNTLEVLPVRTLSRRPLSPLQKANIVYSVNTKMSSERHVRFADFDQKMTMDDCLLTNEANSIFRDRHIPTSHNPPPQKLKVVIRKLSTRKSDSQTNYLVQERDFDLRTHIGLASRTLEQALDGMGQQLQSALAWTYIPHPSKT